MSDEGDGGGTYIYHGRRRNDDIPQCVTHVEVHPSVRAICEIAFLRRTQLTSVTLGVGLEIIGKGAFQECTSLRVIPIPT